MVGFNSVQNSGKWMNFSVKNNKKTLLFVTREFLILLKYILSVNFSWTFTFNTATGPLQRCVSKAIFLKNPFILGWDKIDDRFHLITFEAQVGKTVRAGRYLRGFVFSRFSFFC